MTQADSSPSCDVLPSPTEAQVNIIKVAKRKKDDVARKKLFEVYGDSHTAGSQHAQLLRPAHKAWKCPQCGHMSRDTRHICGNCLAPEPGFLDVKSRSRKDTQQHAATKLDPSSSDGFVKLLRVGETGRSYRIYTEPFKRRKVKHVGPHPATEETGVAAIATNVGYDDEPECCPGDPGDVRMREGECESDEAGECYGPVGSRDVNESSGAKGDGKVTAAAAAGSEGQKRDVPETARRRFTHFVSIPVCKLQAVAPSTNKLLQELREYCLAEKSSSSNLGPELVTKAEKMHITLLLLTLENAEDVQFAKDLLHTAFTSLWSTVKEQAIKELHGAGFSTFKRPMISLGGGLRVMAAGKDNDHLDIAKAGVVYMAPRDAESEMIIRSIQNTVHSCFNELIDDPAEAERSKRILHMTLLNKKWGYSAAKRPFNATKLLDMFNSASIGAGESSDEPFELQFIELNRMSSGRADTDGGYIVEATAML